AFRGSDMRSGIYPAHPRAALAMGAWGVLRKGAKAAIFLAASAVLSFGPNGRAAAQAAQGTPQAQGAPQGLGIPWGQGASHGAAGIVSQEIMPLSSHVYRDMDALYLLLGLGSPSNARPWTKTEAAMILGRVEELRAARPFSRAEASLYAQLSEALKPGLRFSVSEAFQLGLGADMALEAYWHENTADFDTEEEWAYGFEDRKPFLRLRLEFGAGSMFYTYCDLSYARNRFNYLDNYATVDSLYSDGIGAIVHDDADPSLDEAAGAYLSTHSAIYSQAFLTNYLEHSYDVDFQTPKRALVSFGGPIWNMSLSRDRVSWGNGRTGNFIVDGHSDFQDFARLSIFTGGFKYDWLNVFLETNPSSSESEDKEFKVLMAHRIEFRPFKGLTFAVSEDVMYQNEVFDLRYLNPAFIFHNLNNRSMFNAIAHAEVDFSPIRGLNIYGQFVMDQARAPNESASQSDAMGYMGGVEVAIPAGAGIVETSLEFALTTPLLYRRDGIDFMTFRKYFTHGNPAGPGYILSVDYLGYEYGGDAMVLQWDGSFRIPGGAEVGLRLFGMRHGEMYWHKSHNSLGDNDGLADYQGSTPSGDLVDESLVASLAGEYMLKGFWKGSEARVWVQLDWIARRVFSKSSAEYSVPETDIQLTAGLSVSL
ncbi:MAG TPA: hypothetical protein VIO60_02910, partial [Rectinemataceae bacterium]